MNLVADHKAAFEDFLQENLPREKPENLYEPIAYICNIGGKRLRPILTLIAAEGYSGEYKQALPAALTIEVFHNFTLVHDDIMDDAGIRRGQTTVHEKWDINTGILSGDAMLILAYQYLKEYTGATYEQCMKRFTDICLKICEGQQLDVDFEALEKVDMQDYLQMIRFKTAVLVGCALEIGAIIGGADEDQQQAIYKFGEQLGLAFQMQDDYLDTFGNESELGKKIGGDIIENKKTYLYCKALELADKKEANQLCHLFTINPNDPSHKIATTQKIFRDSGAADACLKEIQTYSDQAFLELEKCGIGKEQYQLLKTIGQQLITRSS
ncbi:MAG: polyprenyl synthetase family protein [Psychroflexus sp.]|nr:polyprenyl synthetase family protein [Psychroflexus sp.]